jgi:hypothetical protein
MNVLKTVVLLIVAGGSMLALWLHLGRQPTLETPELSPPVTAEPPSPSGTHEAGNPAVASPAVEAGETSANPHNLQFSRFSTEQVITIFTRLHKQALEGDADAQFVLYRAASYCDETYRAYFDRGRKRRSLDEALHWASTRSAIGMENVRLAHARCSEWKGADRSEYGTADVWLKKATDAGLPEALSMTGVNLLSEASITEEREPELAASKRVEARKLLLNALNRVHPSATWAVGDSLMMLGGEPAVENGQWSVWRLAACNQGYDCSPQADWVVFNCSFDPNCVRGESGVEWIRRSETDFPGDLDQAAAQLAERLNKGGFSEGEFETLISSGP